MNREQAYTLIRQTFAQGFDKVRFRNYAINLLNHIDESKAAVWNTQYVKDAFKNHVSRFERLGTYTSPDNEKLDVLIVHLTTESKLERARTAIRNFVADHLKTRDEKDAALVAVVSPTEKQWRFSYVKMEYATVEKESGKVGVETRLTPARRFSYIVGEGESCHTAQTRFLSLLQDTQTDPKLAAIEEAFSVEAVTKEFFNRYAELFGDIYKALEKLIKKDKSIRDEFQAKNVNTVDFAKKLMGQIVFLYFLQKKGWLGVAKGQYWGAGPHDFLRRLVKGEHGQYNHFFNDILEPLFYDTLATDRGHESWCERFKCRIPFLNGGLFEPPGNYDWRNVDIPLPNRLFTNSDPVEEGITGTGVLDVFDRYNFTVNEAEPLEKEVAIDPEMLGKVFENLIEENRRKGLGAYYTPREIVHYMCQESLINYLDTALNVGRASSLPSEDNHKQDACATLVPLADIETFLHLGDQAAHYEAARMSGTKSYRPELPRSIETHARVIDEKLSEIIVCDPAVGSGAFPVGMMTEIVRSRSALTPYFNDVHERTSYFFKRHAIQNCLYGVDIDPGAVEIAKLRLWLSLVVDEEDVQQIKPLPNLDYKIVAGNSLLGVERDLFNDDFFIQLEKLKPQYFDETDAKKKASLKQQIDNLIHQLTNGNEIFDFEIYFSEVFHRKGGFDVVIANPPYIFSREKLTKEDKVIYKKHYSLTQFKINLYILFIEKSYRLMNNKGTFAFIIPNNWLTLSTTSDLRYFILRNTYGIKLVFNYDNVFEHASVDTCLLIFNKIGDSIISGYKWSNNGIEKVISQSADFYLQNKNHIISNVNSEANEFFILCNKIISQSTPLSCLADVRNGVQAYTVGEGDPIQSKDMKTKRAYHSNLKKGDDWLKYYDGVDVARYRVGWSGQFIKYGKNLSRPRKPELFKGKRLLVRQIPSKPPYCILSCYVDEHAINDNNSMIIKVSNAQTDLKYLLCLINSRLISFWFMHSFGKLQRKIFPQFKVKELRTFPIRTIPLHRQKAFIDIVDKILVVTSQVTGTTSFPCIRDHHFHNLILC